MVNNKKKVLEELRSTDERHMQIQGPITKRSLSKIVRDLGIFLNGYAYLTLVVVRHK